MDRDRFLCYLSLMYQLWNRDDKTDRMRLIIYPQRRWFIMEEHSVTARYHPSHNVIYFTHKYRESESHQLVWYSHWLCEQNCTRATHGLVFAGVKDSSEHASYTRRYIRIHSSDDDLPSDDFDPFDYKYFYLFREEGDIFRLPMSMKVAKNQIDRATSKGRTHHYETAMTKCRLLSILLRERECVDLVSSWMDVMFLVEMAEIERKLRELYDVVIEFTVIPAFSKKITVV